MRFLLLYRKDAAMVDSNLQVIKLRKELMQSQEHMTEIDKVSLELPTHIVGNSNIMHHSYTNLVTAYILV